MTEARNSRPWFMTLALTGTLLFAVSLFLPFFWMIPSFGQPWLTDILRFVFEKKLETRYYSILHGIWALICKGSVKHVAIGTLIFLLSVIFPTVKNIIVIGALAGWVHSERAVKFAKDFGRWSTADVLIVSLFVLCMLDHETGTRVVPGLGFWLFLISVLLSMASSYGIKLANAESVEKTLACAPTKEPIRAMIGEECHRDQDNPVEQPGSESPKGAG